MPFIRDASCNPLSRPPDSDRCIYRRKVALITGGGSGIGRAVAIAFAGEGADVVISYLSEDRDAEETAKWVREAGKRALTIAGDIKNAAHCKQSAEATVQEFERLDANSIVWSQISR